MFLSGISLFHNEFWADEDLEVRSANIPGQCPTAIVQEKPADPELLTMQHSKLQWWTSYDHPTSVRRASAWRSVPGTQKSSSRRLRATETEPETSLGWEPEAGDLTLSMLLD